MLTNYKYQVYETLEFIDNPSINVENSSPTLRRYVNTGWKVIGSYNGKDVKTKKRTVVFLLTKTAFYERD